MQNINDLKNLGYIIENVQNRLFRIKNSYEDNIATIYINSGFIEVENGKIFNYKNEVREAIKKTGVNIFFNL